MSKKDMFSKIVEPCIWDAFYQTYGLQKADPTEKQMQFIASIIQSMYEKFDKTLKIKDLQEMFEIQEVLL